MQQRKIMSDFNERLKVLTENEDPEKRREAWIKLAKDMKAAAKDFNDVADRREMQIKLIRIRDYLPPSFDIAVPNNMLYAGINEK